MAALPGVLDNSSFPDIYYLLNNVQLAQAVEPRIVIRQAVKFISVLCPYVLNMPQPVIYQAMTGSI